MKTKKGAIIGKYYKTLDKAVKYYNSMSETFRKHQSVIEIGNAFMVVGNEQIKAIEA